MSLLDIDTSELYHIFNHDAFSHFVERRLKDAFGETEPQHVVESPHSVVTVSWSPDVETSTQGSHYFEEELVFDDEQEQRSITESEEGKPKKKKPRRSPTNKLVDLPKQSRTTIMRRTKCNKVVWTTTLQQRFQLALSILGTFEATPSDVLHIMNVEGLTRCNISSHLQKYRQRLLRKAKETEEEGHWSDLHCMPAETEHRATISYRQELPEAGTCRYAYNQQRQALLQN